MRVTGQEFSSLSFSAPCMSLHDATIPVWCSCDWCRNAEKEIREAISAAAGAGWGRNAGAHAGKSGRGGGSKSSTGKVCVGIAISVWEPFDEPLARPAPVSQSTHTRKHTLIKHFALRRRLLACC
jgi:hypothetical protein